MSNGNGDEGEVTILVSACLLGEKVRYNGSDVEFDRHLLAEISSRCRLVSFCPELAGGLTVPREPAEITSNSRGADGTGVLSGAARVETTKKEDLTDRFIDGAEKALALCREEGVRIAVLTERSPSCGVTVIYDGSFSGLKIPGKGVTTALLQTHGIRVFSQNQLEELRAVLI